MQFCSSVASLSDDRTTHGVPTVTMLAPGLVLISFHGMACEKLASLLVCTLHSPSSEVLVL
jgi:hypothetical protein